MEKIKVRPVILVEGKYDKIKLESMVDGFILPTDGFGIFVDKERLELIRRLAAARGVLVLTDSDGAGFVNPGIFFRAFCRRNKCAMPIFLIFSARKNASALLPERESSAWRV